MLLRWILPLSVTLLIGILIGRISSGNPEPIEPSDKEATVRSSPSRIAREAEAADPSRRRERTDTPKDEPDRVSVRLKDLKAYLTRRSIVPRGFERAEQDIEPLLSLLGLTNIERDAVKIAFEQTQQDYYAAEKKHVRLKEADDSKVVLDMSGMENFHAGLTENARQRILGSLDAERAEILEKAIDWNGFYNMPRNGEMTLRLHRKSGALWIVQDGGSYSRETRLNDQNFPATSQSVSASDAFGPGATSIGLPDRWSHFLGNKQLVPIDVTDSN